MLSEQDTSPTMDASLPARILIVRLGALGDVVNALALANALVRARPDVEIGWACHELALPILSAHPAIARVHVWRRRSGLSGWRALLGEIRARRYELALDLQRLTKSALIVRCSGAPRRIGFDRQRTKESSWIWANEHVAPESLERPMAEQALDFARHLGLSDLRVQIDLPRDAQAEIWAEDWIRERGGTPILLNLGATKAANRWPAQYWGELAQKIGERTGKVIALTGGPDDCDFATEAARYGAASAINLVGATSLHQLIALQRRASVVVSADTGPMHTAAAVGARVVALFGAADERRTGPFGQIAFVLRTQPECAPCGKRICPLPRHDCMMDLRVEAVLQAVLRRLCESEAHKTKRTDAGFRPA